MNKKIVTRFAPSPTGFLHVGGLRTALYSYLVAKGNGGDFLLRIEDTDQTRTVENGLQNIVDSLFWAGIIPDIGVMKNENGEIIEKGDSGPYIQSKRLDIYEKYANQLVDNGHAYRCFCTPERLAEVKEEKQKNKLPPGYDGFCKNISKEEVKKKIEENISFVVRLAMPDSGNTSFVDEIRGEVVFENENVDDQVILKSDGFPTYHLAVVVDDHLMGVTHVIRGEEWISSTPKHLFLYKCLGWEAPSFSHLPLLLNSDKSKLSKRQGDVAVLDYREKGYLPEALLNFVAFLGWNPGDEREIFSLSELIKTFSISKIGKAGAVFNIDKLDWYNREYIKNLSIEEKMEKVKRYLPARIVEKSSFSTEIFLKVVPIIIERISKFSDVTLMAESGEIDYFFDEPFLNKDILVWKNQTIIDAKEKLSKLEKIISEMPESQFNSVESIKDVILNFAEKEGRGEVLWPLRVCLSGKEKSPDPFLLMFILGKDTVLDRLKKTISVI